MNFFDTVESVFHDWHYDHPRILYALARSMKPKVIVEVGTYRGYAACYLAQACKENGSGHVYCIDDFSEGMQKKYDADHWYQNLRLCGVSTYAALLTGKSTEVLWPQSVDFAYIDGWHGYKMVAHDFAMAAMRGAECICLDDTNSTVGPSLFVQRLRNNSEWDVCEVLRDCGLAICIRKQAKKPISFSQESMTNPGVVMSAMTTAEKRSYLTQVSQETGIDYSDFLLE